MGKRRKRRVPSEGTINYLIDDLLHPLAKGEKRKAVLLLDTALHFINENDPQRSLKKFVRYNLKKLTS